MSDGTNILALFVTDFLGNFHYIPSIDALLRIFREFGLGYFLHYRALFRLPSPNFLAFPINFALSPNRER